MAVRGSKPGKPQAKRGRRNVKRPEPVQHEKRESILPDIPEVPPLYHTFDQPRPEGSYFDWNAANAAIDFIEGLTQFKGKWKGHPLSQMRWQKRIIGHAFGWKRADGLRLIRTVYVEAPRKSGKSTMASGVGLYLAFEDDEGAPEVYFAAYDKDQARICYDAAKNITEQSPELMARSAIYLSKFEIQLTDNPGGYLKPLSRENKKQFGLGPHGLIYDEVMTLEGREMWEAMTTAQGSREQPMTFAITTAGWNHLGIAREHHDLTQQIHEGTAEDPTFLGVVYGVDIDADWLDEENWRKAQPSLGATVSIDFYREKAKSAQNKPTEQNAFRTLLLSQWVGQAERFYEMEAYDQCLDEPDEPAGRAAFGGLDLSATQDLTGFVVVAAREGSPTVLDVYVRAWLPAENIRDRERRDKVPYSVWAEQGFLELTPGNVIDYEFVKAGILEDAARFDLKDVEYDRWNSSQVVKDLENEGIKMVEVGQGFASMSAPMKQSQRLMLQKRYAFGENPLLRWCVSNVAAGVDAAGNVKPDKSRSAHRIDPVSALIMCTDGWMRRGQKRESIYARRRAAAAA
jgi:phage terminase large subunit-like protein